MRNFIRIRTDNENPTYDFLFKVVMGTWKPERARTQARRRSVTGRADTAEGVIVPAYNGVILIPETQRVGSQYVWIDDSGVIYATSDACPGAVQYTFGALTDLENLFDLNDPTGSPSSRLWLYLFQTNFSDFNAWPVSSGAKLIEFVGKYAPENLSPGLVGTEAHYYVPLSMEEVVA